MSGGDTITRAAGTGDALSRRRAPSSCAPFFSQEPYDVVGAAGAALAAAAAPTQRAKIRPLIQPSQEWIFVCLAASLSDSSTSTVGPVPEPSYEACELEQDQSRLAKRGGIVGENPSRMVCPRGASPSSRRGHGDNVASMAGGARRSDKRLVR